MPWKRVRNRKHMPKERVLKKRDLYFRGKWKKGSSAVLRKKEERGKGKPGMAAKEPKNFQKE